jgi:hypothetical protein
LDGWRVKDQKRPEIFQAVFFVLLAFQTGRSKIFFQKKNWLNLHEAKRTKQEYFFALADFKRFF